MFFVHDHVLYDNRLAFKAYLKSVDNMFWGIINLIHSATDWNKFTKEMSYNYNSNYPFLFTSPNMTPTPHTHTQTSNKTNSCLIEVNSHKSMFILLTHRNPKQWLYFSNTNQKYLPMINFTPNQTIFFFMKSGKNLNIARLKETKIIYC